MYWNPGKIGGTKVKTPNQNLALRLFTLIKNKKMFCNRNAIGGMNSFASP